MNYLCYVFDHVDLFIVLKPARQVNLGLEPGGFKKKQRKTKPSG
jgi:hypothetical protein